MESILALVGLLFLMFLVLAAAVEVVLEVFRGLLELCGFTWAKAKMSLEDALSLAKEFAPNNADLITKIQAVQSAAEQIQSRAKQQMNSLETIKKHFQESGADPAIAGELNAVAAAVKTKLQKNERQRVFALRFIAAAVGCVIVYQADFYVFRMLAQAPVSNEFLANLPGLKEEWINIAVGGLGAAAGSSYWHDQLDRIRNLKAAVQEFRKLAVT